MRSFLKTLARLCLPSLLVVLLFVTVFASDEVPELEFSELAGAYPELALSPDSAVMPIAASSLYGRGIQSGSFSQQAFTGTLVANSGAYNHFYISGGIPSGYGNGFKVFQNVAIGLSEKYSAGSVLTVKWSGYVATDTFDLYSGVTSWDCTTGWFTNSYTNNPSVSYALVDQNNTVLASSLSSSGSVTVTLDHDISFIAIRAAYSGSLDSNQSHKFWVGSSSLSFAVAVVDPVESAILDIKVGVQDIAVSNREILDVLKELSVSASQQSPMEQFENNYLDKMEGQLDQIEDMMSSANPALPNGGDIAGFASDIQDGLGISGSSFSSSEFSEALSAFSGSEATAAGGPWEFFTQAVADSLSGEAQTVGLNDDDYIYIWLEQAEGRAGRWR